MFTDGIIDGVIVKSLRRFSDRRGWLIEIFRSDEMAKGDLPTMMYVSETLPGVARGPHEHVEQTDTFGFIGPSDFRLFVWDNRPNSKTYRKRQAIVVGASNPCTVTIPPGVVHAYRNDGDIPGWVVNCPNQLYAGEGKKHPVDEIRHEDVAGSPFEFF